MKNNILSKVSLALTIFLVLALTANSWAIPSFARQTGMSCNTCHTIFPELTAFGRQFKLNGYTMVGIPTVQAVAPADSDNTILNLVKTSPFSAMLQASYTYKSKEQPGTQNDNFSFPQQLSLFVAGSLTPKIGAFIQMTYSDQDGKFSLDNTDIRYADQTELAEQPFTYGVTLNNNPSVQDLWNSTPSWKQPYAASSTSPTPSAATLIEGGLAQSVAGIGIYSLWNNLLYTEISLYKSAQQGSPNPPDSTSAGVLKSLAPYWRVALQKQFDDFYLELGTFGISATMYPKGIAGLTDQYSDLGFDVNIEKAVGDNMFTAHGSYIHESRTLDASVANGNAFNSSGKLNSFQVVGNYYLHSQIGFSLGYFDLSGDGDAILYAPAGVTGSLKGLPDSNGFIAEFNYLPWLNTKLTLQYVAYNKFNGDSTNYDGAGRNASDNNTLYVLCWVAF